MSQLPIIKDLYGNVITPMDLPSDHTGYWRANRKAIVVRAVIGGLITLEEALERYHLTEKEFSIWEQGFKDGGATGLMVTHYQKLRMSRKTTRTDGDK